MREVFTGSLVFWVLLILFNIFVGGYSTEYVVETWGTFITHKPVDVSFAACCLAGLFLAEIMVPIAIVTLLIAPFLI